MRSLVEEGLIPLDKSWLTRLGVLDLLRGGKRIFKVLDAEPVLSDDLLALTRCVKNWQRDVPLDVGESGTLYRFLQFASWKFSLHKRFILRDTLSSRPITKDPSIVDLPLSRLLLLDGGTSQWASAAVLSGSSEVVPSPPYKLALTYEALEHWLKSEEKREKWDIQYDTTILQQAETFSALMEGTSVVFEPLHSEDYCFARALGFIGKKDGENRWPSLHGHESDRLKEMERCLTLLEKGSPIASRDHRVVQAIAMRAMKDGREAIFLYPHSVNKSWPQFSQFLTFIREKVFDFERRPTQG